MPSKQSDMLTTTLSAKSKSLVVWWQDGAHIYVPKLALAHFQIPPPSTLINKSQKMARSRRILYSSHDGIVKTGNVKTSQLPWVMF
jgi:hypothetical protein